MLRIYSYDTPNGLKPVLTAEELGLDYELVKVDLRAGQQRSPEHLERHCLGKIPVLQTGHGCLIESNAICRYLSRSADFALYSNDPWRAAEIDSAIDFVQFHPGRWVLVYFWEEMIKPALFNAAPDPAALGEAQGFLAQQLPELERRLEAAQFLCGEQLTLADTIAFPLFRTTRNTSCDLSQYPAIERWIDAMAARPSVQSSLSRLAA